MCIRDSLEEEFVLRKKKNLPPFVRLIAFIVSSKNERDGLIEAKKIKKILSSIQNIDVMGPVTSPIFKIKNNYRTRLLLRSSINLFPQKQINQALKLFKEPCEITLTTDSTFVKNGISKWIFSWKKYGWKTAAKKSVKRKTG